MKRNLGARKLGQERAGRVMLKSLVALIVCGGQEDMAARSVISAADCVLCTPCDVQTVMLGLAYLAR